jgi:hypothetical protein
MPKSVKTRAQWVEEIVAAHKQSIESILEMGRTLIAARNALDHGEFLKMIEGDLPFDASTAQRLMKIARDKRLQNAARVQFLPMAWGTLYELTKANDEEFEQATSSGAIHSKMTRDEAKAVRTVKVKSTQKTKRIAATYYQSPDPEPARVVKPNKTDDDSAPQRETTNLPPSDAASLTLSEIERLADDLAMAFERGDVRADPVFKGRVRAMADRLLALVSDDDRGALN